MRSRASWTAPARTMANSWRLVSMLTHGGHRLEAWGQIGLLAEAVALADALLEVQALRGVQLHITVRRRQHVTIVAALYGKAGPSRLNATIVGRQRWLMRCWKSRLSGVYSCKSHPLWGSMTGSPGSRG